MTAEVKTGRLGEMASKNPAETGAMIPVLSLSAPSPDEHEGTRWRSITYSRERAADVPHAVPRIDVPNVSGVIPSIEAMSVSFSVGVI